MQFGDLPLNPLNARAFFYGFFFKNIENEIYNKEGHQKKNIPWLQESIFLKIILKIFNINFRTKII